jgi:hypothetical protein
MFKYEWDGLRKSAGAESDGCDEKPRVRERRGLSGIESFEIREELWRRDISHGSRSNFSDAGKWHLSLRI